MPNTQSLMRSNLYYISDNTSVYVPTLGEIYDYGEDEYYRIAQLLTAVPYDLMVQFDDIGMDYEDVDEYQLFLMLIETLSMDDTDLSIFFRGADLTRLKVVRNTDSNEVVMIDENQNCIINHRIQNLISNGIRHIHFWEKNLKKAGNKEAKQYLIERNRVKQMRAARKPKKSFLDDSIIQMVNTEEFKYNYEQCMDLSVYKFNASLKQIPKKKNWENTIAGAYFGTVDLSTLNIEKIHWMS